MLRIGIDEKAFRKARSCIALIYDMDRSTVGAISDDNDIHAGNTAFSDLSEDQLARVDAIVMDMIATDVRSAKENISLAEDKIVHDRLQIMKLAAEAVDKVRRGEYCRLVELGDHRLPGTRYLWLTGQERTIDSRHKRFDEVYTRQLETGKAWACKEILRDLWQHGKNLLTISSKTGKAETSIRI